VQLLVVPEPGREPLRAVAVGPEDVRDEPDRLPGLGEQAAQPFGQLGLVRNGEEPRGLAPAARRASAHRAARSAAGSPALAAMPARSGIRGSRARPAS